MFFIGWRQWLSLPHYRSRREAHLVTLWETTQERSLIFLVNPDSVIRLTPGAATTTSLFGMMTVAASVVAVSIATDRFLHRHRFFTDFRYCYYGYPYNYAYYDFGPVYDDRYSSGLAMMVQAELAGRGYYRGPINGVIGSGIRRAIREFQAAEGLPITGRIDEIWCG
jgi:hypothetical protein